MRFFALPLPTGPWSAAPARALRRSVRGQQPRRLEAPEPRAPRREGLQLVRRRPPALAVQAGHRLPPVLREAVLILLAPALQAERPDEERPFRVHGAVREADAIRGPGQGFCQAPERRSHGGVQLNGLEEELLARPAAAVRQQQRVSRWLGPDETQAVVGQRQARIQPQGLEQQLPRRAPGAEGRQREALAGAQERAQERQRGRVVVVQLQGPQAERPRVELRAAAGELHHLLGLERRRQAGVSAGPGGVELQRLQVELHARPTLAVWQLHHLLEPHAGGQVVVGHSPGRVELYAPHVEAPLRPCGAVDELHVLLGVQRQGQVHEVQQVALVELQDARAPVPLLAPALLVREVQPVVRLQAPVPEGRDALQLLPRDRLLRGRRGGRLLPQAPRPRQRQDGHLGRPRRAGRGRRKGVRP
mmetsp:Transcript_55643/g.178517  ORF Transcript_55643/g.178517 Transcript_55643/m.178517 type:complete len:418 (+) Transcript_55643:1-1254(+)